MKTVLQYGLMVLIVLSGITKGNTQCGAGDAIIQNISGDISINGSNYGQSFTATCTGEIGEISVWYHTVPVGPVDADVTVIIYEGEASNSSPILSTDTELYPTSTGRESYTIDNPVAVTAGQTYTFVIFPSESGVRFQTKLENPYSGGTVVYNQSGLWTNETNEDMRFEVGFIDSEPPEVVCQDFTAILDATGNYTVQISDIDGGSTDDTGITSYSVEPSVLTCEDLAGASVEFTVRDNNGNQSSCIANATVIGTANACASFFDDAFITTWVTDNPGTSNDNQITIPTHIDSSYNYIVDWGDGTLETGITGDATHTYSTSGTYTVKIKGSFPRIYFNNTGDRRKLVSIDQWGNNTWESMDLSFWGCQSLMLNATDAPDLSNVTSLRRMFSRNRSSRR